MSADEPANPGELREDIPLRPNDSAGLSRKFGGIRLIIASFTILSLAVTIALATQIYYGDFEIVPHGSVATDSRECSWIGTDILKSGGNSVDAAIAAAFCLSVINPHTTGLDAGGVMMMYQYKNSRSVGNDPPPPIMVDFSEALIPSKIPHLVKGLAFVHDKFGRLPWNELIEPSIQLARYGFSVPTSLIDAISTTGTDLFQPIERGQNYTLPKLATYLERVADGNVSTYFLNANYSDISTFEASFLTIEDFVIYTPSVDTASTIFKFLRIPRKDINSSTDNFNNPNIINRKARNLQMILGKHLTSAPTSNVAVIDKDDFYVSLITGLHGLLGSQRISEDGYILNEPASIPPQKGSSNFVPIIITQHYTCGQRIVLSCGEMSGALQVIQSLVGSQYSPNQLATSLENPRLRLLNIQTLAYEENHMPQFAKLVIEDLRTLNPELTTAPEPYPTCNAVQQIGDSLSSHADSRGGGLASRF